MGALDGVFRDVAEVVVDVFMDTEVTLQRRAVTYDPLTSLESTVTTTITILASPPFDYEEKKIDGKDILKTDQFRLVPAKTLEAKSFDPRRGTDIDVILVDNESESFAVKSAKKQDGGDLAAFYQLQLRK